VVGAVGKLGIRPHLPDFQAEWESPAVGLFHEACFSTAHLPTNSAIDPIFDIPNQRKEHAAIRNNIGPGRAWRAPSHPQAANITMNALNDADRLDMDPLDLWLKNLNIAGTRKEIFRQELGIASDLMGWRGKWQPRGQNKSGSIARGLGLSMHTWGGRGHDSECDITIHADGSVAIKMGSQDLGHGNPHRHFHCCCRDARHNCRGH
jgi:CO/xanthine dehydrogenase Mo-binding subunit